MLTDLHAHTSGISRCCRIPYTKVLEETLAHGMDGIVLTNHYQKSYIKDGNVSDFVERYIDEYYVTAKEGSRLGCSVLFGIEVTMELYPAVHMLIYGVDPDFLRKYPTLYDYTQEELYSIVKENNGILIQAHPFRNGATVLDTDYLDGIEINCHPLYGKSYREKLYEIASDESLILTCGGDYHADTYRPKCGVYLPDEITDHFGLRDFLLTKGDLVLCVHEPNRSDAEDVIYCRK